MEGLPTLDALLAHAPLARDAASPIAPEFRRAMVGLSLAVGHALSEEQLAVYAHVLRDVDLRSLRRACVAIAKTALFWPKPAELIAQVEALARDETARRRAEFEARLPAPNDADPSTWVRCRNCGDDGWVHHRCPGGAARTCGRGSKGQFVTDAATTRAYYSGACQSAHGYVVRCTCASVHDARRAAAGDRE